MDITDNTDMTTENRPTRLYLLARPNQFCHHESTRPNSCSQRYNNPLPLSLLRWVFPFFRPSLLSTPDVSEIDPF